MEEFNLLLLFIWIILFSVFCLLLLKSSLTIPQILSCLFLVEMVHLIFYQPPIHATPFYSGGVLMQTQCSWRDVTLTDSHCQKSALSLVWSKMSHSLFSLQKDYFDLFKMKRRLFLVLRFISTVWKYNFVFNNVHLPKVL